MSEISLVVKQASLAEMEQAMTAAHEAITSQIKDLLTRVNGRIDGWDPSTASRAAEIDYQRRLSDGVERLARALEDVRTRLGEVAAAAHECEVENVALVD